MIPSNNSNYDFYLNIDKFFIEDISTIDLIGVIRITKENFNKIDAIILKHYNDINNLPLILLFNNISDITDIPLGTLFRLPILSELVDNIFIIDDTSNIGTIPNTNINKTQINNNKTTASPKLNITMKKVEYDIINGIISF